MSLTPEQLIEKNINIVKERLEISTNYAKDQFILACCNCNSRIKVLVCLILANRVHKNYWMLGLNFEYDFNPDSYINFKSLMDNPVINFDKLYNSFFYINITQLLKYLNELKVPRNKYADIDYIYNIRIAYGDKIIKNVLCEEEQQFRYREPSIKYDANECPVCMNEKMRYVWLTCGHQLCKDCYEKIIKRQGHNSIKCPCCNQLVYHV